MSVYDDIEEFTEKQLIDEVRRRQVARRDGFCWYCGRRQPICTCKHQDDVLMEIAPKIVCLCGSTRFGDAFRDTLRTETLKGHIVISVGLLGHAEGLDMNGSIKVMLDRLHFRKIDISDEVLILNVGGYIGSSTRNEINYAKSIGKPVRYLEVNHDE